MPFVTINDIRMYYEIAGSGPRLLYISGTGADLRNKPNIFDSPLINYFEILAFDQRGLGQTDRPDIPYTMAQYANDAAAILNACNWEKCHVMGISFGGMVAQELALRHEDLIDRMVLCCTSSGGEGGHSYPFHSIADLPADEFNALYISINDTRHDDGWQQRHPEERQALLLQMNAADAGAGEPGREVGAKRQLEARIGHDTFARLPTLRLPVLIAGGRYDGIAPPDNLRSLHHQIPDSELQFFEGGHDFYDHDPSAYDRLRSFLLEG